jgi:hypothetical protein
MSVTLRVRTRIEREAAHRFYTHLGFRNTKIQLILDREVS